MQEQFPNSHKQHIRANIECYGAYSVRRITTSEIT